MSNSIVNATERRLSMFQFGGMFFLIVVLCCLTFYRSCLMHQELPKAELALLKEKEPMMKNLGELGNLLQKYEDAQKTNSSTINSLAASAESKSKLIHQQLAGKDTARTFNDVKRTLEMADHYYIFIKSAGQQTEQKVKTLEKEAQELRNQITKLDNDVQDKISEIKNLKTNLETCRDLLRNK